MIMEAGLRSENPYVGTRRVGHQAAHDIPETRDEARQILGWPRNRPIVLAVRRLTRRMGLVELIAAAQIIRRRVPDVLILIAGRGILAGELEAQIRAADMQDHVQMLGFLPDSKLPLAYRAADITVVPSLALEGFGLSAAESLAAGTPAPQFSESAACLK